MSCPVIPTIGSSSAWAASSYIAKRGELLIEETPDGEFKLKIGNGVGVYADLPYVVNEDLGLPTIEYDLVETAGPGSPWEAVITGGIVESALYVPPPQADWPVGEWSKVLRVEGPASSTAPIWWVSLPSVGLLTADLSEMVIEFRDSLDADVGHALDPGLASWSIVQGNHGFMAEVVAVDEGNGLEWHGHAPGDGAMLAYWLLTYANDQERALASASHPGTPGQRPLNLDAWWLTSQAIHTQPVNIAIIGDSKTEQQSPFSEGRPWPYLLERMLNGGLPDLNDGAGYRAAVTGDALVPAFTTNAGSANTTSTAGRGTTLTTGQKATITATMDGFSLVYSTSPGAGSIEVRDGVGGTLLATIATDATAKSGHIWTSGALASASRTIELTSVGTTVVDGCYIHQGNRSRGARVWKLARSGATNDDLVANPSWALDFIETNAADLDLVILAGGTNDAASYDANTRALLDAVLATGYTGPIALLVPEFNANLTLANDHQADAHLIAAEYGIGLIDMAAAMRRVPLESGPYAGLSVHQNAEGQWLYARTALAVLSGDPFGALARIDRIKSRVWQVGTAKTAITAGGAITITEAGGTVHTFGPAGVSLNGGSHMFNNAGMMWNSDSIIGRTAANELAILSPLALFFGSPADGLLELAKLRLVESADPAAQAANEVAVYAKNDGGRSRLYARDDGAVRAVAFSDDVPTPFPRAVGEYVSSVLAGRAGTGHNMTAAGVLQITPIWLTAGAIDRLAVWSTVAAVSTWRLGLYPIVNGTPAGQAPLIAGDTVNLNAAAGVQPVTVSYTVPVSGWYGFAVLVDAYTATPTVYAQSGSAADNLGIPTPWPGMRCRTGIPTPLGGWRATGVATGAIPATCPAVIDVTAVATGYARLA